MHIDTTCRSVEPEIMDDFAMEGAILTDALDKIASINKLLGGNAATLEGIGLLIEGVSRKRDIRIVDVGCGNGAMLRMLADYGRRKGLRFDLLGIDANAATIAHARKLSQNDTSISYQCSDIFQAPLERCDIVLFTLTLHHFKDDQVISLLENIRPKASLGIVVNDLQRSRLAYRLFTALSYVFGLNSMSREDGLVSILRGFKRQDFLQYEQELQIKQSHIRWRWAFRYLWIIKTS